MGGKKNMTSLQLIKKNVLSLPPHKPIYYLKDEMPHPLILGFQNDNGEPDGQLADYRFVLEDGKSIHVKEYEEHYSVHWDWVDPRKDWIEHLRRDAPVWYTLLCSTSGAGLGALATAPSKNKDVIIQSSVIGGIIGAIVGAITAEWE